MGNVCRQIDNYYVALFVTSTLSGRQGVRGQPAPAFLSFPSPIARLYAILERNYAFGGRKWPELNMNARIAVALFWYTKKKGS